MAPTVEAPPKSALARSSLLAFAGLFLLCYAPALFSLGRDWMLDSDMGHGFFVPAVVAYILWQQKDELLALPVRSSWAGLPLVLLGAAMSMLGTLGAEMFTARFALVVSLAGGVWMLGGAGWLRKTAFPLFLLCFMVPLPRVIFNSITFPLQLLATRLAEQFLTLVGIPVAREGNILELATGKLSVVEACSGIRSLLSLTFLSLVYGYFFEKRRWVRIVLFAATLPIAILANAARVTVTGILSQIKPELAEGFFHESTGWIIFMVALGILVLAHRAVLVTAKLVRGRA